MSVKGQAVQIVRLDKKSDGLELDIDALAEICLNEKCRDKPICVVSIAGDFRKGKSFMLNFFLRYLYHVSEKQQGQQKEQEEGDGKDNKENSEDLDKDWMGDPNEELKGFSWRGGSKPETTGILVWGDPIVIKRPNGQEVAVLLMDTQGAFDSRQTIGQTAIIFALSTLASSLQIYNVMNNIQEDNLQILDTFLGYGQLVLDESSEKPFQELCFLVRDWRSPRDYSYGAEGGLALLKEKLDLDDEESSDNDTRRRINNCFERKACFLMPYPGEQVSVEEGGPFRGQISDMKENFVEHLKTFVPSVLSPENLLVKQIGGEEVNGQGLLEYFKVYAETFKGEKIPEAKTLYDATAEASNLVAVVNAKNYYLEAMKQICGPHKPYVNPKILEQKHSQLLKESLNMFESTKKLGSQDYSKTYFDQLAKELLDNFEDFVKNNDSKNMFNMWGSPLILLCSWFIAFTLSRLFEIIGITPLANLLYLHATISFIGIIAYLSMKYTGNFPDIVVTVDKVAEFCWAKVMDTAIGHITQQVRPIQARQSG